MDPAGPERLHTLMMELVRVIGMVELDHAVAGQPVSLSQAFAVHELDTDVPLSQRDLARRLRLDKSSVSRMAAELERRGILVRERDSDNRRFYRLRLTDRGRELHRGIATAIHERYVRWTEAMTPAEIDALLIGLAALVRAVQATESETEAGTEAGSEAGAGTGAGTGSEAGTGSGVGPGAGQGPRPGQ